MLLYVFTKLLRPLIQYWRKQGVRVILYIDDGIVVEKSKEQELETSCMVLRALARAVFLTNIAQCKWQPDRRCTWLGFEIDLVQGSISASKKQADDKLRLGQSKTAC